MWAGKVWCQYITAIIKPKSLTDLHLVAAIKAAENYENIAVGFANAFNEINGLINNPILTINGVDYDLDFFLSSDYKVIILLSTLFALNLVYTQFTLA